jgi:hypothetical protein
VEDEERRDAEEKGEKAKVAAGPLPKPNDWQRAKVQQRRADPDAYIVDSTIPLKSLACAQRENHPELRKRTLVVMLKKKN